MIYGIRLALMQRPPDEVLCSAEALVRVWKRSIPGKTLGCWGVDMPDVGGDAVRDPAAPSDG